METNSPSETVTNAPADPHGDQSESVVTLSAHESRHTEDSEGINEDTGDPQPFSNSEHAQLTLDRSSEVARLRTAPQQELAGSIRVDRSRVSVGEAVGVAWDVSSVDGRFLGHMDFLGMFEVNEGAPVEIDNLLDSKLRGFNSSQSGRVNWLILSDHFHEPAATIEVCFCYFDHQHILRAQSPTVTLINPSPDLNSPISQQPTTQSGATPFEIQIYNIHCSNLRAKTFGVPDPFLKLNIACCRTGPKLSHHGQKAATDVVHDTVNPHWNERFVFRVLLSDVLEVTVRDKFNVSRPTVSHFLGRVKVQLSEFLHYSGARTMTFELQKRLPSDRVRGTITLSVDNDALPPDPTGSHGNQQTEPSTTEATLVPVSATPPQPHALRAARLTSLCSEDSISSVDAHMTDLPEEGGAESAASPGNDDIIEVQSLADAATAESANCENKTEVIDNTVVTMETTSSEPNKHQVMFEQDTNKARLDDDPTEGDAPAGGAANEKTKSLEELNMIRLTLYGSRRRPPASEKRRSHTVISRHVSLRAPPPSRSHDLSPDGQRMSGSTSLYQLNSSNITESLPPNWEIRSGASGMPLYYDHKNKVVRLDLPVGETGQSSPRISDFVRRSNLNLLQRQPSQPVPESSYDDTTPLTRSCTISGDIRHVRNRRENKPVQRVTSPAKPAEPESEAAAGGEESKLSIMSRGEVSEDSVSHVPPSTEERSGPQNVDGGGDKMKESSSGGEVVDREDVKEVEEEGRNLVVEGRSEKKEEEEKLTVEGESEEKEEEKLTVEVSQLSIEGDEERVKSKLEGGTGTGQLDAEGNGFPARQLSVDDSVRQSPGFRFITRPDLYKFAKDTGNESFFKNLAILELIQTIRSDHTLYTKYQHSSKLVSVINSFALTDCELPSGWEKKMDPSSKKPVFIDHNSRQTTFFDPRLPYPGNELTSSAESQQLGIVARSRPYVSEEPDGLRPQQRLRLPSQFNRPSSEGEIVIRSSSFTSSAPAFGPLSGIHLAAASSAPSVEVPQLSPVLSPDGQDSDTNYSERVVMFLRQPNIFPLLRSRYDRNISYNMRDAIETIQREGVAALERMQREMDTLYFDLTVMLSVFDEEISHFTFPVSSVRSTGGGHVTATSDTADNSVSAFLRRLNSAPSSSTSDDDSVSLTSSVSTAPSEEPPLVDVATHTYGGIPISHIIEFFEQSNIYHQVLSRYNRITSDHREFIEWFQRASNGVEGVEDRLRSTGALRSFVDGLRSRIDDFVTSQHPDSSDGAQDQPPEVENHTLAGMTMEQILTFFRNAEESERILAPDVLMPLIGEYSAYELEELLTEDVTVRRVVMRYREEITQQRFPTVDQIKSFFRQPNIDRIISSHVSISSEDRETVEYIVHTPVELLSERLMWDRSMKRFISSWTDAILAYDEQDTPPPVLYLDLDNFSPVATPTHPHTRLSPPPPPPTAPPAPLSSQRKKQEFIEKLRQLQRKLERGGYSDADYTQNANFHRTTLLADAYRFIMGTPAKDLRRRQLNVHWGREEGLDYGGPQREFFFKLSRELFNPYYGLFEYSASGSYTVQISPQSAMIEDAQQWFRFAGRLIGYAIIQGQLLDVFFARHVYKALLGSNYTISDVEAIDIPFYNSLTYVLENDPEPLDLTFTVLEEVFGQQTEYELRPGGADISVVEENKQEYVELMVRWRLSNGILAQTESMVKGLKEMIPPQYLNAFDAQELEWVIAGTPEINMEDWKSNTVYWGGYHKDHLVIQWFWQVVEAYSTEQKLRLLQFVIGTSSIPFEGFKALRGSSSLQKFTIDRKGGTNAIFSLPIAHTCFNRLDLPEYPSINLLAEKLTLAIEECGSFENA